MVLFTEKQKRTIQHVYCSGLRIVFSLQKWDDETTLILCREKSILDYLYLYWCRFSLHLERSAESLCFQQTWQAYKIATSSDRSWYRSMGFNRRSFFPRRLAERAQHSLVEWKVFEEVHRKQHEFYKTNNVLINMFVYKYFLSLPSGDMK